MQTKSIMGKSKGVGSISREEQVQRPRLEGNKQNRRPAQLAPVEWKHWIRDEVRAGGGTERKAVSRAGVSVESGLCVCHCE